MFYLKILSSWFFWKPEFSFWLKLLVCRCAMAAWLWAINNTIPYNFSSALLFDDICLHLTSKFNLFLDLKFSLRGLLLLYHFCNWNRECLHLWSELMHVHTINWTRFEGICFLSGSYWCASAQMIFLDSSKIFILRDLLI